MLFLFISLQMSKKSSNFAAEKLQRRMLYGF